MVRLGLLIRHKYLGYKLNLHSNMVRFLSRSHLTLSVMTRRDVQATQTSCTISDWQGNCYVYGRESSYFHDRVWGSLSGHLGVF